MGRRPNNDIEPGQLFGRLKTIERVNGSTWKCECTCGTVVDKLSTALRGKLVQSCGCLVKDTKRTPPPSKPITIDGVTKTTLEWSAETGVPHRIIRQRINLGWKEKDAVNIPVRARKPNVALRGDTGDNVPN